MPELATLYVTTPDRNEAITLGQALVEERLAACANILDGMTSIYRWEGELQASAETVLLLKTTARLIPAATARLRELHSYDCPCIVAWPIIGGSETYARWVESSVFPNGS